MAEQGSHLADPGGGAVPARPILVFGYGRDDQAGPQERRDPRCVRPRWEREREREREPQRDWKLRRQPERTGQRTGTGRSGGATLASIAGKRCWSDRARPPGRHEVGQQPADSIAAVGNAPFRRLEVGCCAEAATAPAVETGRTTAAHARQSRRGNVARRGAQAVRRRGEQDEPPASAIDEEGAGGERSPAQLPAAWTRDDGAPNGGTATTRRARRGRSRSRRAARSYYLPPPPPPAPPRPSPSLSGRTAASPGDRH